MSKIKIVNGLDLREVINGGTEFEVKSEETSTEINDTENEINYIDALEEHLKLECLDQDSSYDGEPFKKIAESMQNLLQNGKIKKIVIREGYGSKPEKFTNVKINYNAYVQYEAQPFDSTYARKLPFTFTIGQGEVIQGLEIAVQSMKINEKSQFLIDPEFAYRSSGMDRVPPNSLVLFEIELCDVNANPLNQNTSEINEKEFKHVYPKCLALCVRGKDMVRLKDYHGAIKQYNTAVNKLEDAILENYDEQMKSEALLVRLYTNLLICYSNAEIPKRGCTMAQKIHEMAKNNTFKVSAKVYFNHAKCQRMLGGFRQAERNLRQAKALNPSTEIDEEIANLNKAREEYKKQQAKLGKAFVGAS